MHMHMPMYNALIIVPVYSEECGRIVHGHGNFQPRGVGREGSNLHIASRGRCVVGLVEPSAWSDGARRNVS